jgi:membrane protease YdiL (CAAX protease family)
MQPSPSSNWIKRFQVPLFFVLTLAISWAVWIPAAVAKMNGQGTALAPEGLLGGLARWVPGLVAVLLVLLAAGKKGAGRLFQPIRTWRVGLFWYLAALFLQVLIFYAGRLVDTWFGNQYTVVSPLISVYGSRAALMAPMLILFALPGAFAEELGWRGFALPRLQKTTSALLSSIVIAIIWGAWHVPLMIYFGQESLKDIAGIALAVLNFIPVAVVYTWIYNNTGGSLLLVTLFHLGQQLSNNFLGVLPTHTDEIMYWVVAVVILVVAGMQSFSRNAPKHQTDD